MLLSSQGGNYNSDQASGRGCTEPFAHVSHNLHMAIDIFPTMDVETEAQKGKITHPQGHNVSLAELGFELYFPQ